MKPGSLSCPRLSLLGVLFVSLFAHVGAGEPASVALVKDGQPLAALVLPAEPHADEELAAKELQTHLRQMSGGELAVGGEAPDGMLPIRVGLSLSPEAETTIRAKSEDPAALLMSVTPHGIRLAGLSPEGTLFAAYELLEQLGVRWYLPGDLGTVVPRRQTVSLPVGDLCRAPSFPNRHVSISRALPWYRRQRLGGLYFISAHGIGLLPKADPEKDVALGALRNGKRSLRQLCVSNPEVVKRATAAALNFFEKRPDMPWIGMGPNDGGGFCECENCRALDAGEWDPYAAEHSVTDRYVWLFNQILEGVHQKYPGKKIGFYAYHAYKLPPRKHKPNPCIVPAFAPITLCRSHGLSNPICPDRSFYRSIMKDWGELLPAVFERGYYFNLACPGFPWSKVQAVRDETPVAHELGIKGWRVECVPSWAPNGLTNYVATRLMWDVQTDVDALLAEFYEKFFGPASAPMGEYLDSIERQVRDTDCHTGCSYCIPKFFPKEWMGPAKKLLEEAARRAGKGIYGQRVRIYRLNYDMLEAFLEMLEARNRFDFAAAQTALERLDHIIEVMIHFRLYPNPSTEEEFDEQEKKIRYSKSDARLLYWRTARPYMRRFWRAATETGYERTCVKGDFVAGAPDEWDFLIDTTDVGETVGWFRAGRIGGGWRKLRTKTASWSEQGLHYYKGLAWYRTEVVIPEEFRGRTIMLWFGGVDEKAKVWVNDVLLGASKEKAHGLPGEAGSFKPFELDATGAVRFGEPNTMAVRIENRRLNEIGTGGITAPVMFWSPKPEGEE